MFLYYTITFVCNQLDAIKDVFTNYDDKTTNFFTNHKAVCEFVLYSSKREEISKEVELL